MQSCAHSDLIVLQVSLIKERMGLDMLEHDCEAYRRAHDESSGHGGGGGDGGGHQHELVMPEQADRLTQPLLGAQHEVPAESSPVRWLEPSVLVASFLSRSPPLSFTHSHTLS
jgi:hypothetical protein